MVSKLIYSARKVNPFSGIIFAIRSIHKKRVADIIDSQLGSRAKQAVYSFSDVILSWSFCNLCGAERLEDLAKLGYYFKNVDALKLPSPDSIGLILRSLAGKTSEFTSKGRNDKKINHQYSIHLTLNRLLLSIILRLKLLNTSKRYVLDYDNVLIDNKKWDSRRHYQQRTGYQPGVSFIGRIPVYIEGRNGNTVAMHHMEQTLARNLDLMDEHKIQINVFRSDSAAYQGKVIKLMDDRNILFYIRARPNKDIYNDLGWRTKWVNAHVSGSDYETMSMEHALHGCKDAFRLVIYRKLNGDEVRYWSIITNDWNKTAQEIIWFYNQRGAIEQNFDILKNDFNWRRLPFSYLNENTVFMIVSAITCVIYHYLIRNYSKKVDFVKRKFRLKNFIYHFIIVASVWENGALKLFTDRDYSPLIEDG